MFRSGKSLIKKFIKKKKNVAMSSQPNWSRTRIEMILTKMNCLKMTGMVRRATLKMTHQSPDTNLTLPGNFTLKIKVLCHIDRHTQSLFTC